MLHRAVVAILLASIAAPGPSAPIRRVAEPDFPISTAVEVPAGSTLLYVSGQVPPVVDASAPAGSVAAYGDTETQTVNVLKRIETILAAENLGMGDVVMMRVFLVGDPKNDGRMDFAGMMKGYRRFFGTATQPAKPARSTVQVAGLAAPGFLVEIEVTAARPR